MNLIFYNIEWMAFNLYLAILPVIFAWFILKTKHKTLKFIVGILWILYLPNTIYIITDLHHLIKQWEIVNVLEKLVLVMQYLLLEAIGLVCFFIAFQPFEKWITKSFYLIAINFIMAFAMVLGKIERVNSWDVFTNPLNVAISAIHVLTSFETITLVILFGLFANFLYFLFREKIKIF